MGERGQRKGPAGRPGDLDRKKENRNPSTENWGRTRSDENAYPRIFSGVRGDTSPSGGQNTKGKLT